MDDTATSHSCGWLFCMVQTDYQGWFERFFAIDLEWILGLAYKRFPKNSKRF